MTKNEAFQARVTNLKNVFQFISQYWKDFDGMREAEKVNLVDSHEKEFLRLGFTFIPAMVSNAGRIVAFLADESAPVPKEQLNLFDETKQLNLWEK
jgi:hypothetical protein